MKKYLVLILMGVMLISFSSSPLWASGANTLSLGNAKKFVEDFIKLPLSKDADALEASLADNFVYRVEIADSNEDFLLEVGLDVYLSAVLGDWDAFDMLDVKIIRIRESSTQSPGRVSISAYYDVWHRDDWGINGPLREVCHFDLVEEDGRWLITQLTYVM